MEWTAQGGVTIPESVQEVTGHGTWGYGLVLMMVFDDLGGLYQLK